MAKYSDIKGFTVQTLSSDTVASQLEGGSWSSGGNVNTARASGGGAGTAQTEALLFGGTSGSNVANTEQYNGSSWTETADLNNARSLMGGTGTYTAALAAGGSSPGQYVESWNGSAWTETTDLNTARRGNNGLFGTQPAAIITGGYLPGGPGTATTEQWNGSSWTEVNDLNTARWALTTGGTTTAGIAAAGEVSPKGQTETWNGSSWTETTDLNTGRGEIGGSGGSSAQTALLVFGGGSSQTKTENFNGSTWTELSDMATYRGQLPKTNIANTGALAISGGVPGSPYNAATEHFDAPSIFSKQVEGQLFFNSTTNTFKETISDVPGAAWASGTSINTARQRLGGAGLQTANVVFAGTEPPVSAKTEEWNGSTWTEKNDMNTARYGPFSFGVYNAAIAATGYNGSTNVNNVESWDGTNWTEVAEVNSARRNSDGFGTSTAGLIAGGITVTANCETWNGSAWTEVADLNEGRGELATSGKGTTTSGIVFGGEEPSLSANTEEWNGSSWTELNNLNTARKELAGNGTATSALGYAGNTATPKRAVTEFWNGTSWTEVADLSTGKNTSAGVGASGLSAMNVAGDGPSVTNTVEEWTVNLGNKTITTS